MTEHVNLLDILTEGHELPEGCDTWGIRAVHPDGASRNGFVWPLTPSWAEAPGPIDHANIGPCPTRAGDGICLAYSWGGMASGGIVARTLLLCAYGASDVLGRSSGGDISRLRRARVVAVVDGERLIREHGRNADLFAANLAGARLSGADLRDARLYCADLRGADLSGANLRGANLCSVDLSGANLRDANLWCVNLNDANLSGADLSGTCLDITEREC